MHLYYSILFLKTRLQCLQVVLSFNSGIINIIIENTDKITLHNKNSKPNPSNGNVKMPITKAIIDADKYCLNIEKSLL